jgi:hypothetical protein
MMVSEIFAMGGDCGGGNRGHGYNSDCGGCGRCGGCYRYGGSYRNYAKYSYGYYNGYSRSGYSSSHGGYGASHSRGLLGLLG